MRFYSIFLALITLFLISNVLALEFVKPSSFDGSDLKLYPEISTTIEFLKLEAGTQVFVDTISCENIKCGELKISGPYYIFDISSKEQAGKITINYHLKGLETAKQSVINVFNDYNNLQVLVFMPSDVKFFNKTEVKVLLVNKSDLKLTGQVFSNFPEDVFTPVDFIIDAKSQIEYTTYFYPKSAGYFDVTYLLKVNNTKEELETGSHTVKVNRDLIDFLSLPTKSFFPTNPVESLYASIIYFISLLA